MSAHVQQVHSWGRLTGGPHRVLNLVDRASAAELVRAALPGIPFGNGRSYGDVCLNPHGTIWNTRRLDRFIAFDEEEGIIECEAGVLLGDILDLTTPKGWFLPVVPGTQFATVGGAIANDVHGKGHHQTGSFGHHVLRVELLRTDGTRIWCGPDRDADWFRATVGGLGLTGLILSAKLRLTRIDGPWLDVESVAFHGLEAFFQLSHESRSEWPYAVAWVDCSSVSSRGIFFRARHCSGNHRLPSSVRLRVPITPPFSAINRLSVPLFNRVYFRLQKRRSALRPMHYRPYFFTLDGIADWNRLYGRRGFYQYQCVVPRASESGAMKALFQTIAAHHVGSMLVVLKVFGDFESAGLLSFPMPGTTLAIDFPNRGEATLELLTHLDEVVLAAGGRLYPAKDARMSVGVFETGFPEHIEFRKFRDPGVSSAMSRRLLGW